MTTMRRRLTFSNLPQNFGYQKKKIVKWCVWGAVIGLVIAFSIPREYATSVKLAPEISDPKAATGGLSALASIAGLSSGAASGADAVYPRLYPGVVRLSAFHHKPLQRRGGNKGRRREIHCAKQYMEDETSSPWWSVILGVREK